MRSDGRYYFLDTLKIICTLLIMFHHYQQCFEVRFSEVNFYGGLFNCGYLVELFFMISGFLAANSIQRRPKPVVKDFVHRALRLYPMAIVTCGYFLLLYFGYTNFMGAWIFPQESHDLPNIVRSFLLLPQPEGEFTLNNPTWYLAGLIQCFIVMEACRKFAQHFPQWKNALFYTVFVTSSLCLITNLPHPFIILRALVPFFAGILLREAFQQEGFREKGRKLAVFTLLLSVGLCFAKIDFFLGNGRVQQLLLVFMIYPSLLFLGITSRRIINNDDIYIYISYISSISFGAYLWHFPIYATFIAFCTCMYNAVPSGLGDMIVLAIVVSFLSVASYECIEKRFSAWAKRVESR